MGGRAAGARGARSAPRGSGGRREGRSGGCRGPAGVALPPPPPGRVPAPPEGGRERGRLRGNGASSAPRARGERPERGRRWKLFAQL
ncbi:hypothetical protein DV515_00001897 [Chloebia gouldiae]|uniref:Uncharacterized protein n=1 Tax=Chloebia gouldiae TaxID=44316 RepID=A0A3L8SXZ0_CHLGU|nr:hypothetical protein DV515_00001897 [Chloebia gouldiae]